MRIAKPMLLITTPIGLGFGIYEAFRLAGGLAFLMIALVSLIGVAMATVVVTVRREKREEEAAARAREAQSAPPGDNGMGGETK
jgi:hypothetical protein